MIALFDIMKTDKGEEVTVGGWEFSGVCEAIKIGLSKLYGISKVFLLSRKVLIFKLEKAILEKKTGTLTLAIKKPIRFLTGIYMKTR